MMLFEVPSRSGMPRAAIESVKISVAAFSSAGRSIGIVIFVSTRSGRAPALRAASSSDESARDERRLAGQERDRQQARRLDERHARDRVDRERRHVQPLGEHRRQVAARAPDDEPAEDHPERGQQDRQEDQAAERACRRARSVRCTRIATSGARRRTAISVVSDANASVFPQACQNAPSPKRSRYGWSVKHAAGLVERAVAQRCVEQRDERADDEHDDQRARSPSGSPPPEQAPAWAGERLLVGDRGLVARSDPPCASRRSRASAS